MPQSPMQEMLRRLPGVDAILLAPALREAAESAPRKLLVESIRQVLEEKRSFILENPGEAASLSLDVDTLAALARDRLETLSEYTLKPVVNATGIVIHTNLGRSLLPEEAVERLVLLVRSYNNLEYDLEEGRRGSRYTHAEAILCELTGAEAALVVNNNAAAVLLSLNTLARGREVVVSRGQLVEIGGSFRIPDVMRSSGAVLREVGTTNRTHPADYENAIDPEKTACLMKVHTSNYRIEGFTSEVPLDELVRIGRKHGVPVIEDLGSGSFVDFGDFGLHGEPTVQDAVKSGADLVTFSGDKLLGGPQAGVILGGRDLVAQCRKNPMTRAFRVDKMTLAALEATLRLYRDPRRAVERIPTLRMIATPLPELEERARLLASNIRDTTERNAIEVHVRSSSSQVGGGSLPARDLPTYAVAVKATGLSANRLEAFLRANRPPVIGRIESDTLLLDVRTLCEGDLELVTEAFRRLAATTGSARTEP